MVHKRDAKGEKQLIKPSLTMGKEKIIKKKSSPSSKIKDTHLKHTYFAPIVLGAKIVDQKSHS